MNAISFAITVLNMLPSLISTGKDIVKFIEESNTALKAMQAEGRNPTDEEWDTLNKAIEDLRAQRPDP